MTQYEEAEGLTFAMCHEFLLRAGWKEIPSGGWELGDVKICPQENCATPLHWVGALAGDLSIQQFLREINPRMRKGWPTDEAMAAHPGKWLVGFPDIEFLVSWESYTIRERKDQQAPHANVEHWPIDERGNKVPYPRAPGGG